MNSRVVVVVVVVLVEEFYHHQSDFFSSSSHSCFPTPQDIGEVSSCNRIESTSNDPNLKIFRFVFFSSTRLSSENPHRYLFPRFRDKIVRDYEQKIYGGVRPESIRQEHERFQRFVPLRVQSRHDNSKISGHMKKFAF